MAPSHDADELSPEDKIHSWLNLDKDSKGHFKSGDWMSTLTPHLKLDSVSTSSSSLPSVTFAFTCQSDHCNRLYNLHGGCAATLFDYCTTLPLSLINKPGYWQFMGVSRTLNVTYMRPVPVGEETLIECEILQVGKKLCTLRGTMRRKKDGMLLAICEHGKVNVDPEPKL